MCRGKGRELAWPAGQVNNWVKSIAFRDWGLEQTMYGTLS